MALSKNLQYVVAGAVAVYIVFFTRPAPAVVVQLLASPLAQIAVLCGVVYLGATQSLLVALLLAVAVVLSMPAREYMTDKPKKEEKKKATEHESDVDTLDGKKKSAIDNVKPSESEQKKESFSNARDETLDGHPF